MDHVSRKFFLCAALVLASGRMAAQSPSTTDDGNRVVVASDTRWDVAGFVDSARVDASFSIGGVLEVGVGMGLARDEIDDEEARELGGRILIAVLPLRQARGVPVSLRLHGSYGLSRTHSDYLEDSGMTVRGQGFTAGLDLLREFRLQNVAFRLGVNAEYRSYIYTTDTEAPPASTTAREGRIEYGALAGLGLFLRSGAVISVDGVVTTDSDATIRLGPIVRLSIPTIGS